MVDGTPILDIKPYLPAYDGPQDGVRFPDWVDNDKRPFESRIVYTSEAQADLERICEGGEGGEQLRMLSGAEEVRRAIREVLQAEPRSYFRRQQMAKGENLVYLFTVDNLNIRCQYAEAEKAVRIYALEHWPRGAPLPEPSRLPPL